jgi:hypothetical protein
VHPEDVQGLIFDCHAFISGLKAETVVKPIQAPPIEDSERLKSDLARIRRNRNDLKHELKAAKELETTLKEEVLHLNNKLAAERDLAASDNEKCNVQNERASLSP